MDKSDTPRTDAEYSKLADPRTTFYADGWDWARQLERENAELLEALKMIACRDRMVSTKRLAQIAYQQCVELSQAAIARAQGETK